MMYSPRQHCSLKSRPKLLQKNSGETITMYATLAQGFCSVYPRVAASQGKGGYLLLALLPPRGEMLS